MSDSSSMQKVAQLGELRAATPKRVKIGDTSILLIREDDTVRAFSADCPHAGAPLEEGAICHGKLICPWHKGTFDCTNGALLEPPALSGLSRYPVKIDGDDVLVSTQAEAPMAAMHVDAAQAGKEQTFAIVGGGAAGAAACASLREFGFKGRLVLIDQETTTPYDRTALSKFVPSGELKPDDVYPLLPDDFFKTHEIETLHASVKKLDATKREIAFDSAPSLHYDAALLATGSAPKTPSIRGVDDPALKRHIVMLRNLDDAKRLDRLADEGGHAVVIGSSFIALEVGSALCKRKLRVTVVSPEKTPFGKIFGDEIGRHFARLHEQNGATLRMSTETEAIVSGDPVQVKLKGGGSVPCDFVVVGTGVAPVSDFLEGVARNEDGGVDVDASMRAQDALYVAGDIAAFETQSGKRARIEHWRVAQQQARMAARAMLGLETEALAVPFFWTYHAEKRFDYLGHSQSGDWDDVVMIGTLDEDNFVALFAKNKSVLAALACNRETAAAVLSEAMRNPLSVDDARRLIDAADRSA